MRISREWLQEWIDVAQIDTPLLAQYLTQLGLEVDDIETLSLIPASVKVGKIIKATPHPDAEKLQITEVDVGEKTPLTIVCGAPNAREGLYVATALVGTDLGEGFKIKESKIRGIKSFGMLCSKKELGLGSDHDGIMELSATDQEIGHRVATHLMLEDTVLTLGLTPNRADCLSYLGVARDLSALLHKPLLKALPDPMAHLEEPSSFQVTVEQSDQCGRFVVLEMKGVKPVSSPHWLKRRLLAQGLRPINLIVDATNYVMFELGQPIHAYDREKLSGPALGVRFAKEGESLTTLDGKTHSLHPSDLVIHDNRSSLGLAGVMGGASSEVTEATTEIVIEGAVFCAQAIRQTAKRLSIHTDASHRFERGVDISKVREACLRVAEVISKGMEDLGLACPKTLPLFDHYPQKRPISPLALRLERVEEILGLKIKDEECIRILERLGCRYVDRKDDRVLFEVPSWRLDILREVDLIEEIARVHGYDKLPYSLPKMDIGLNIEDPMIEFTERLKVAVAHSGFHEVIQFPFVSQDDLARLRLPENHFFRQCVQIANPLSEEGRYLQTTLSINLLRALLNNHRFQDYGCQLFEMARCFIREGEAKPIDPFKTQGRHITGKARRDQRPLERLILGGVVDEAPHPKTWRGAEAPRGFFDIKEHLFALGKAFGVCELRFEPIHPADYPFLNPKRSAAIVGLDQGLGYVGQLHPESAKAFGFPLDHIPYLFELDVEGFWERSRDRHPHVGSPTRFPPVTRDLAFTIDTTRTHEDFAKAMEAFSSSNLREYDLFDLYRGDQIEASKKSMAYRFVFQSSEKTLHDKEVDKELERLKSHLEKELGAQLR